MKLTIDRIAIAIFIAVFLMFGVATLAQNDDVPVVTPLAEETIEATEPVAESTQVVVDANNGEPVIIEIPPIPTSDFGSTDWIVYILTIALIVYVGLDKLFQWGTIKTLSNSNSPLMRLGLNTAGSVTQMTDSPKDDELVQYWMRTLGYEVQFRDDGGFYAMRKPTLAEIDQQVYGKPGQPAEITDEKSKQLISELDEMAKEPNG